VVVDLPFPFTPGSPVSSRDARFEALLPSGVRSLATPSPGQGEVAASVLSWAFSPLERAPPRFRVRSLTSTYGAGVRRPDHVCLREPSHLASIARPELRRLGSRTQDLPARCGRSNPRATVRQRPSLEIRSRRFSTPVACLTPREGSEASCLRPLSAAPRASRALHDRYPQGVPVAGPRRRWL